VGGSGRLEHEDGTPCEDPDHHEGCPPELTVARFKWNMLPPELLAQLDEPLRGLALWPSWAYTRIRCDFLSFTKWPKIMYSTHFPSTSTRPVTPEEVPDIIEAIKSQVITRRILGEEF